MLNIAYIGNGKSTNRYHIPFSSKVKGINIKKIYSPAETPWEKIEGVEYVKDIEDIWNDSEIQLVVITTPPQAHYQLAKGALENNKNVLVEKPFTETAEEARELFDLAKQKGLHCQGYQNRRFDSDFLTVQKVIESGVLGDILEVEASFDYFRPEFPESIHEYSRLDSFLYGHACHTVDQILSYFGDPDDIHYEVRQLLGKNRMSDYFDLDFFYANGKKVSIKSSFFRLVPRPSFVVYGKKGQFNKYYKDIQEDHLKKFYMPTNSDFGVDSPEQYGVVTYVDDAGVYHEEKVVSEVGGYDRFYEALYETLINGKEKLVKDEETIRLVEILETAAKTLEDRN